MNNNLKELIAIRDGAPKEAIGINRHCDYIYHAIGIRSLDDIKELIRLMQENKRLQEQVQEYWDRLRYLNGFSNE